jgi:hypothetical protein
VIGTAGAFPPGQVTEGGGRALGVGCRTSPGDHFSALDDPASATFLLGQSLMPGINALLLGSLMYRLVPRLIPVMGLIEGPILIAVVMVRLFGSSGSIAGGGGLAGIPVAAWVLSLGVRLVVKGFRPSPITTGMDAATMPAAHQDVAV